MADAVVKRDHLSPEATWRLEDIFPDAGAWEEAMGEVQRKAEAFQAFRGRVGESARTLADVLAAEDDIMRLLEKVYGWAMLRHDEDPQASAGVAALQKVESLAAATGAMTAFVRPELVALPEGRLAAYLRDEARLAPYRHTLLDIERRRTHILSPDVEEALTAMEPAIRGAATTASQLSDADLDLGTVEDGEGRELPLTHGRYGLYVTSSDRVLRRHAYLAMHRAYESHRNTFAATFTQNVRADVTEARLRRYRSSLAMRLDERSLPETVYHNLVEAVHEALPDLHRYVAWRERRLGVGDLHFYDLYPPIAPDPGETVSWEEAKEAVRAALAPLGSSYLQRLDRVLDDRYVDPMENQGKRSGAYSMDVYDVHPYILMSFTGRREGVFTLAHEAGHALHAILSSENQTYRNAQYPIFLAEIASTANEHLLLDHLLGRTADPTERLVLLDKQAQNFLSTVFRQTLFAEFEQGAHQEVEAGGALTAEGLRERYEGLLRTYYGPRLAVDPVGTYEWARIPHFYRSFYVFQYATGFISAAALARAVVHDGPPAAGRYLAFLSAGGSDDPLPILRRAGVDLDTPAALSAGLALFGQLVDQLESFS